MERIIDDYESRRRAEEIYSRKNGINIRNNNKKYFSIYKIFFQILFLINLAISFLVYKNKDYIFKDDFLNSVNNFYNINIGEKINSFFYDENNIENNDKKDDNIEIENKDTEEISEEKNVDENLKESYSFIKPVEGTITSFFGNRESSNPNISGFHTGIDISAVKGSEILSAISGNVIQVSGEGNYGNHLKIQNDEIITLYAHCDSILVKQGDFIIQGQEIAKVGSTGNSTGPHLHFEIRYKDQYLDPCEYIKF